MKWIKNVNFALIITVLAVVGGMNGEEHRNGHIRLGSSYSTANQRACFEVIRSFYSIKEMYEMVDPPEEKLKSFDEKVQEMLIEKRYLSRTTKYPTEKCEYSSEGDLTKDGVIYCKFHGDIDNKLKIWNEDKARGDAKRHSNWFLI
ncbi:MAG: hypothetical protein II567_15510, partial [Candidatus Riflebacteria bacterium]|nr:hypothetical protein [Candidatus Riflebacteria bacterium]